MTKLDVKHLGRMTYEDAMPLMEELFLKKQQNEIPDTLLVLEHDPVITRGRKIKDQVLPMQNQIAKQGVQVINADRGGELTYHGPGQIVVYFILELQNHFSGIRDMVTALEDSLIDFLKNHNVIAETKPDHPGIWVNEKKVASLGLRVSRGFTKHGIALNVKNDLQIYQLFQPCGLSGNTMTSMEVLFGRSISDDEYQTFEHELVQSFLARFRLKTHS